MSFLSRHRTICAVIQEMQEIARMHNDTRIVTLCDEAFIYARAMSAKLTKYKWEEQQRGSPDNASRANPERQL